MSHLSDLSPTSELRLHCVLLHCRGKVRPYRLRSRSWAGSGAGVVTSFARKSGLQLLLLSEREIFTNVLYPLSHKYICNGAVLIQPDYFIILPRVKTSCSSCVKMATWSRCRVLIPRPRSRPKPSSCPCYPEDLSGSGASNLESRSCLVFLSFSLLGFNCTCPCYSFITSHLYLASTPTHTHTVPHSYRLIMYYSSIFLSFPAVLKIV